VGSRLRALSAAELWVLAQAWLLLPLVALGLLALPYDRLERTLRRRVSARSRPRPAAGPGDRRVAELVAIASHRHVVRTHCLERALTARWLLAGRGIAADLRIGVRLEGGRLAAHAWLETGGRSCSEAPGAALGFALLRPARMAEASLPGRSTSRAAAADQG